MVSVQSLVETIDILQGKSKWVDFEYYFSNVTLCQIKCCIQLYKVAFYVYEFSLVQIYIKRSCSVEPQRLYIGGYSCQL